MRIHTDTIDGKVVNIGYKVVTADLQSLGLRKNPNILTFSLGEELHLPEDHIEPGKGDWGGIWLARVPSGATKLRQYMKEMHNQETKIFKATVGEILYVNNYRIKTNRVKLYQEI